MLFKATPRLVDIFDFVRWKARRHEDGKACDRIIVSDVLAKG